LIEKTNSAWIDLSKDWYDVEPADYKRATDRMLSQVRSGVKSNRRSFDSFRRTGTRSG
jgi:hypothetical protein